MKKFISILGSTGSIGRNTLKIIDRKKKLFTPFIFSANKNYKEICRQIKIYKPIYFLINNELICEKIRKKFPKTKTTVINNLEKIKTKKNQTLLSLRYPVSKD